MCKSEIFDLLDASRPSTMRSLDSARLRLRARLSRVELGSRLNRHALQQNPHGLAFCFTLPLSKEGPLMMPGDEDLDSGRTPSV